MKVLLKSIKVIDKSSAWHHQVVDILIQNGKIQKIGKNIKETNIKTIDYKSCYVSPGFVDMNANFGDPGFEHKEDIHSGLDTAMSGGYTHIALMPSTQPSIQSKSDVEYLINKSKNHLVNLLPVGTLSTNREGKDITEMHDMKQSGAVAFSDADHSVQDAGLMARALLYAKGINSFIISFCEDASIAAKGKINEGVMSTSLGMKGNPALSEELMISRDIFLAEYQNAKVHFTQVSTAKSAELIKAAKKKGLNVTADVSIHHLSYDENILEEFDSNFKLRPPLRTANDVKALKQALKEGTIDAISSAHRPEEPELKMVEFEIAAYGMISLQTLLSQALKLESKQYEWADIIENLTHKPAAILGIYKPSVKEGEDADLCIYDVNQVWTLDEKSSFSKSRNSDLFGKELKGKVKAVINNDQLNTY